jgi:hypothetical protein
LIERRPVDVDRSSVKAELLRGCLVEGERGGAGVADPGQEGVEHLPVGAELLQVDSELGWDRPTTWLRGTGAQRRLSASGEYSLLSPR